MATVMGFCTMMQIPRRLSHHVPRVPILETDNYVCRKDSLEVRSTLFCFYFSRWFNIDMDEYQLYKMAHLEVYSISEVAKMEIVGDPNGCSQARLQPLGSQQVQPGQHEGTQIFPGRKGFNRGGVDGYLEIHSGIKLFGQDLSLAVER